MKAFRMKFTDRNDLMNFIFFRKGGSLWHNK